MGRFKVFPAIGGKPSCIMWIAYFGIFAALMKLAQVFLN